MSDKDQNDQQSNLPEAPELLRSLNELQELTLRYETAMKFVLNKLDYLNKEFELHRGYSLTDSVQSRMKSPQSILEKVQRKHLPMTVAGVMNGIHDVAGVRVIVRFLDDIEVLKQLLATQPDIKVQKEKDYVHRPKPNGYQSLHLILLVPVYVADGARFVQVELQIRTIAMNFWASLEHELNYKKHVTDKVQLAAEMTQKAKLITQLDYEMNDIKRHIWHNDQSNETK